MATIHTPVKGFAGVVAGVSFVAGVGESSDSSALAYFERQGYTVNVENESPQTPPADPDKGDGGESKGEPEQPEGDGTVLERPAGNASVEAWSAFAVQEGHDVVDLKREDIKALFTE